MVSTSNSQDLNETDFVKQMKTQYAEDLATYGFKLEAPGYVKSSTAKFYYVRHGMSLHNYEAARILKDYGANSQEEINQMKNENCVDPDLHDLGRAQAEYNSPRVTCLNAKYVLVSPMQRAVQTAIHMFKFHPNVANIKFIIVPELHEIMHTFNDMHMDPAELVQKYAEG